MNPFLYSDGSVLFSLRVQCLLSVSVCQLLLALYVFSFSALKTLMKYVILYEP